MKTLKLTAKIAKYLVTNTNLVPYLISAGVTYLLLIMVIYSNQAEILNFAAITFVNIVMVIHLFVFIKIMTIETAKEIYLGIKNKYYNL